MCVFSTDNSLYLRNGEIARAVVAIVINRKLHKLVHITRKSLILMTMKGHYAPCFFSCVVLWLNGIS